MNERVYPRESPPNSEEHPSAKLIVESPSPSPPVSGQHHPLNMSQDSFASSKMSYASYGYVPNPGTYLVQIPKDQVYKVPPPENAHKYKLYTEKKAQRGGCKCCVCTMLAIILIVVALIAVGASIFYLIYNPKAPNYSIENVNVKGFNLATTATTSTISPTFNVTLKTQNNNAKIGIYYEKGSEIDIYHDGINLCNGELPTFYEPPRSVTVFSTTLSGAGIVLSKVAREKLLTEQKRGNVPLEIDIKVPVKIKVGSIKSWTIIVEVSCDVTINALTINATIVSRNCNVNVKPW